MARKPVAYRVVAPVMNRKCSIPSGFPISLSEDVALRKIRGDDLAIITERNNEAATYLNGGNFTITIDNFDITKTDEQLNEELLCSLFSLNTISSGSALAVDRVFVLGSGPIDLRGAI